MDDKRYTDIDKKEEKKKNNHSELVSSLIGIVCAFFVGGILKHFFPTFGEFWQIMVLIPVWCLLLMLTLWLFLSPRYQKKEVWWKRFLRELIGAYVAYFMLIGLELLMGYSVQSASHLLIIILIFRLPHTIYQQRKEMREAELKAMRKDEDLYERAMKQMEGVPHASF